MSHGQWFVAAGLIVALMGGCVRPAPRSNIKLTVNSPVATTTADNGAGKVQPEALPAPREEAAIQYNRTEPGVITGRVVWEGPLPTGAAAGRLAIQPDNRGVADVVVWANIKAATVPAAPRGELQLIQRDLAFRPMVQVGRTGAHLKLLCADDRASFKAVGAADFNLLLTQGKHKHHVLDRSGLVEIRSQLRPEQTAYIWVFDHDAFALTDKDGQFRLPGVPTGAQLVTLWHPGWRPIETENPTVVAPVRQQVEVNLGEGQGAEIRWKLAN
jgi:hypothetical protein